MAICRVRDIHDTTFLQYYAGAWLLGLVAAALAFVVARRRFGRRLGLGGPPAAWSDGRLVLAAIGMGLISVPAWRVLLLVGPDLIRTFCAEGNLNLVIPPGQVLPPSLSYQLSSQVIGSTVAPLGYVILGSLFVLHASQPHWWRHPRLASAAHALRFLVPSGASEARSTGMGLALFPLLVVANLGLLLATNLLGLRTGDDSQVFAKMSLFHVVTLACAAGVSEEVVYRGVMQQGTRGLLRGVGVPRKVALVLGLAAQSLVFAYAHTGYANIQHLVFAFLFAILAGIVVQVWGMWTGIVLHVLIDAYSFLFSRPDGVAIAVMLVAAVPLLWLAWREWSRIVHGMRQRRAGNLSS